MGRSFLSLVSVCWCLACAGRSARDAEESSGGASTGGVTSGGVSPTSGGASLTGGTSTSGGTGHACYRSLFPPTNPTRTGAAGGSVSVPDATCSEPGEFCDFEDGVCGRVEPKGACLRRDSCRDDDGPLCGCDGNIYASSCAALALGIDVDAEALCHLEGQYVCGAKPCTLENEACIGYGSHIDSSVYAQCVPLSEACRSALISGEDRFCECVSAGRCQCQVQQSSGGIAVFKLCTDR